MAKAKLSVAATAKKLANMKFDTSGYITLTSISKLAATAQHPTVSPKVKKKFA